MSLRLVSFVLCATTALPVLGKELRVCADPDSMPYSRQDQSGFENRIAALAAEALGATLVYTWHPQHRNFVRTTVDANRCDVWMGVPTGFEPMLTTRPYYKSTYVFVFSDRKPLVSFDQPNLKELKIVPRDLQADLQRSEEHTSELQSLRHLVCRLLLEKKKNKNKKTKQQKKKKTHDHNKKRTKKDKQCGQRQDKTRKGEDKSRTDTINN